MEPVKELVTDSVDRLFAEPFEPLWMKWQREGGQDELIANIDHAWCRAAAESRARIAARSRNGKYENPPDTRIAV